MTTVTTLNPIINSITKDYNIIDGLAENGNTLITECYARIQLVLQPTQWMYSTATLVSGGFNNSKAILTKTQFKNVFTSALQPLIDNGRITALDISCTSAVLGDYTFEIGITDNMNNNINLLWNYRV